MSNSILQSYWNEREVVRREAARSGHVGLTGRLAWQDVLRRHLPTGRRGIHVLDAGCGASVVPSVLAGLRTRCTGADRSQPLLDVLQQRSEENGDKIELVNGDVEALDFENATFDAITAINVLSIAERPPEMLAEWMRLLAPDGQLIVIEDDRSSAEFPLYQKAQMQQSDAICDSAWIAAAQYLPLWQASSGEIESVLTNGGWQDVSLTKAAGQLARKGQYRWQSYSLGYQIISAKKGGSISIS